MKKTLVTIDNLDGHICQASETLYIDGTKILTAGAKDALVKKGITLVYGPHPTAAACPSCSHACTTPASSQGMAGNETPGLERLVLGVAAILKSEYGVTDPEELRTISLQVIKTIKDNI